MACARSSVSAARLRPSSRIGGSMSKRPSGCTSTRLRRASAGGKLDGLGPRDAAHVREHVEADGVADHGQPAEALLLAVVEQVVGRVDRLGEGGGRRDVADPDERDLHGRAAR